MSLQELHSLLIIFVISALSPFLCEWVPRIRLPLVVLEIGLGVVVGPQILGWAAAGPTIQVLSNFGLAFLFFLAGFEVDFAAIRGRPLILAALGWLVSFVVCLGVGLALQGTGLVASGLIVGAALTTTALGTLMPILRDAKELPTRFGAYAVAAGAMGEFGPIILIATLLSGSEGEGAHGGSLLLLVLFSAIILAAVVAALRVRPPSIVLMLRAKMHTSAQLPVRVAVLILAGLVIMARDLGLDAILGALAAGVVVSLASSGEAGETLRHKIEGIGFGFFVPIFFVTTGLRYDLTALLSSQTALILLPVFLMLFLLVRGLPVILIRQDLDGTARMALALISATQLPLVVAITEIGVRSGNLQTEIAASLVGAGMVSVLIFPIAALTLRRMHAGPSGDVLDPSHRDSSESSPA